MLSPLLPPLLPPPWLPIQLCCQLCQQYRTERHSRSSSNSNNSESSCDWCHKLQVPYWLSEPRESSRVWVELGTSNAFNTFIEIHCTQTRDAVWDPTAVYRGSLHNFSLTKRHFLGGSVAAFWEGAACSEGCSEPEVSGRNSALHPARLADHRLLEPEGACFVSTPELPNEIFCGVLTLILYIWFFFPFLWEECHT